jgi:signal peptidase I
VPGLLVAGVALLAASSIGVVALRRNVAVVTVVGASMWPALATGDRVLVRRSTLGDVRTGQIIVIERPDKHGGWASDPPGWPPGDREWLIKRVAAIPGKPMPEAILTATASQAAGLTVVPAGKLVVLGDNATSSLDSRDIGLVPGERLLGVMLRPLSATHRPPIASMR